MIHIICDSLLHGFQKSCQNCSQINIKHIEPSNPPTHNIQQQGTHPKPPIQTLHSFPILNSLGATFQLILVSFKEFIRFWNWRAISLPPTLAEQREHHRIKCFAVSWVRGLLLFLIFVNVGIHQFIPPIHHGNLQQLNDVISTQWQPQTYLFFFVGLGIFQSIVHPLCEGDYVDGSWCKALLFFAINFISWVSWSHWWLSGASPDHN